MRALVYLGQRYGRGAVQLREIAKKEGISEKYLEQIFYRLRRASIVKTKKGPGGGYELGDNPATIKLIDILSAVGESLAPVFCVADNKTARCPRSKNCPARPYWEKLKEVIEEFFNNHTLADIGKNAKKKG